MNKSGLYLKNIVLEYSLQFYRCMFIPKCLHKLYSSSLATTKNYYNNHLAIKGSLLKSYFPLLLKSKVYSVFFCHWHSTAASIFKKLTKTFKIYIHTWHKRHPGAQISILTQSFLPFYSLFDWVTSHFRIWPETSAVCTT